MLDTGRMPALSGSLTYARLFVEGELPADFRERFVEAIALRVMKPLEPEDDAPERSGWCAMSDPFQLELDYEHVFYNSYVNLGFRTDRWVIPGPLLRAQVRDAQAEYLAKKGRERLGKREKEEIKEMVLRQLRKQTAPVTRTIDLSWSLDEGIVRFFSHSQRPILAMSDLFTKTFGLKLVPEAPFTLASRLGLTDEQQAAWDALEPTYLAAFPAALSSTLSTVEA